ncbi:MAG: hypothetical protein ACYTEV_13740, partial [Planctomycetota bacterium]
MDERAAVQSARVDVHDQIRQRLQPRNMGVAGGVSTVTGDAGTCLTCGDSISMIRTRVEPACNEPCSEFGGSEDGCGSMHEFAGDCGSCG